MCGIAGMWAPGIAANAELQGGMLASLHHRGPDSSGRWQNEDQSVCLLHTRLAIVDLTPQGHQPMVSASGDHVVTFNGEIYNHLDIRRRLGDQVVWRGHSDTETLLAAVEAWGLERTLAELVGMFACAIWDRRNATLAIARDRMGEKPLYVAQTDRGVYFASELKALRNCPGIDFELDAEAVAGYFQLGYVGVPRSIHRGVKKLLPGSYAVLRHWTSPVESVRYWRVPKPQMGSSLSDAESIDMTEASLRTAISQQLLSDVPLGAFLSGGIDSSLIVALMTQVASQRVKTFSMGIADASEDESQYARAIAEHLGCEHVELIASAEDIIGMVPHVAQTYDEPFADSSQVPSMLLSKLTRQHVTVALTGDGGDELFGGYNRHLIANRMAHGMGRLPLIMRQGAAAVLRCPPAFAYDGLAAWLRRRGGSRIPPKLSEKVARMAAFLSAADEHGCYVSAISQSIDDGERFAAPSSSKFDLHLPDCEGPLASQMMWWDMQSYMPDDILVKVDRAAMAYSLEARAPFLDHRLVELAQSLPLRCKIRGRQTKWVLREILSRYIPRSMFERPKQGFTLPLDHWLRGPLRDWADAYLNGAAIQHSDYLDKGRVSAMWHEHLSGRRNHQRAIWTVLMFLAWHQESRSAS